MRLYYICILDFLFDGLKRLFNFRSIINVNMAGVGLLVFNDIGNKFKKLVNTFTLGTYYWYYRDSDEFRKIFVIKSIPFPFSSPFLSGLFCLGVFVAGRNLDLVSKLAERKSMAWSAPVLNAISSVMPSFYLFFPSGKMVEGSWASVHGQFVATGYIFSAGGYSLVYTATFLVFSILLLSRRDFI